MQAKLRIALDVTVSEKVLTFVRLLIFLQLASLLLHLEPPPPPPPPPRKKNGDDDDDTRIHFVRA